jgi:hypothetical protein
MAGTPDRTARVSVARRNLNEAEGQIPPRGTRTAYEASRRRLRGETRRLSAAFRLSYNSSRSVSHWNYSQRPVSAISRRWVVGRD